MSLTDLLETLWQTNAAGVSIVISSLGIGRLSVLLLQDYYPIALSPLPLSCLDVLLYGLLFYILQTNNIIIAYVFGFQVEWQTVFSDAGTLSQFDGSFSTLTDSQYFN